MPCYDTCELNDQSTTGLSDTQERIVEAARELFFQKGYYATGIAEILKRSGANSGSLYHFFSTKEDLLAAVLGKYRKMLRPRVIDPAFERVSDPIERVFAVLDGYRQLLEATDFALGCPIGNLALEISNAHPVVRERVVENFQGWADEIAGSIEQASGRLPVGTDSKQLADYVLATMEGAVMLARAYRDFRPFDNAVHQLRDHFDRLIADGTMWSTPRD